MGDLSLNRRVLSIQSHVVHGYVGNKSATFPLQVLGFEVDAINSVQLSNHTGYKSIKGQVLQEKEIAELFEGLEANDLLQCYTHLLTGYTGNASFLRRISNIVMKLRRINSNIIYVCDPVMGDNGKMYVPEELLPIYREEIVPLADIITPNQYEVELLTEKKISNENDVWSAVQWFHDRGIDTVVISSSELGKENELRAFLSKKNGSRYIINIPRQGNGISFTGTGDLFASLFLAHSYGTKDLGSAFEKTIASLQAVIKRTIESMPKDVLSGKRKVTAHECELKLIQSKSVIENPLVVLKAQQFK
ncbi:PREDICTED: pyridoxal kinase [Rhagoletis zephyria]|uniref:pyridoxal kinase n=1 Tax=Rhagoletis zephyria TaxID=28612 RepID=UPI0008118E2D|nr:PREDICTED: pyridoxal kinase [Rhagoletis zephyria]XP_017465857.1 PREDICTED: pyridoxal kinase [Rhagoletis zephyria]XP_017465859.1 PREDICTED: pyridoxal kinase [Rhagoletis zephyria]XP_017465860.1 PREDICTED: pyridoxal kinase [Rhagoletis zephyria]XP_017465861.1 PREDICTED: pyridoxal kinase [Rhagoletis zephyria]